MVETDASTMLVALYSGRTLVFGRPAADGDHLCALTVRRRSANQADSAFHPFGVDKWVVGCN